MRFLKNNDKLSTIDILAIEYKILFKPMSKRELKRLRKKVRVLKK